MILFLLFIKHLTFWKKAHHQNNCKECNNYYYLLTEWDNNIIIDLITNCFIA